MLSLMCSCTVLLVPAEAVVDVLRTKKNKTHFVPKAPRLSPKSPAKRSPKTPPKNHPGGVFDTILEGYYGTIRGFNGTIQGVQEYIWRF